VRLLLVAIAIASCLFVLRAAALFGFSRLLVTYSLASGNLAAAKKAIQLTPKDAEAHVAGAALMSAAGTLDQAVVELERAVSLRPNDYELWSELGLLRDQTGDSTAALAAFDEAISRAPFYSQPRWNRGNVLLRRGQYEAAFNDLSQAAESNPELIPNLIDLAWSMSKADVKLTEQLAQINSARKRMAFARLLARRGKAEEALAELGDAGNVPETIRRELVEQLLTRNAFKQAFDIWKVDHGLGNKNLGPSIYDGGFEGPLAFAEGGFGWRVPRDLQAVSISLDSSQPQSGAKDLRIEFGGNSNPGSILVSQMILVEPSRRYKINFTSRSQDVVTGGLPLLVVSDASGDQKRLGKSAPLSKGTRDWQLSSFEFTTTPTTAAVVLSLTRENCTTSPCPVFGSISLDSFSLEELK
jgi:tetratricopeptide (TPR) repeat protein